MSKFSEDIKKIILRGLVFNQTNIEFKTFSYTFNDFCILLNSQHLDPEEDDIIVYEKKIFWDDQSIWFSNQSLLEKVRIKFLTAGITVEDDLEDDTNQTLIMKVPSSIGWDSSLHGRRMKL